MKIISRTQNLLSSQMRPLKCCRVKSAAQI